MEFSKRKILIESWGIVKENLSFLIMVVLILGGLNLLMSIIQNSIFEETGVQGWIFIIASNLFLMGLGLGVVRIALNILDRKEFSVNQMFQSFHLLIPYLLASLIYLVLVLIAALPGIMLLFYSISQDWGNILDFDSFGMWEILLPGLVILIPVTYLSLRLQFYNYFIVDEECGFVESVKKSADIARGYVGELFLIQMVLMVIILISIIPLGLGLLFSAPLAIMVMAVIYRQLKTAL